MPVSSVAISVEGVLHKQISSAPIPVGIAMYHSLKDNFNILLYSEKGRKELDHWLALEALNAHAAVEYNENQRIWLDEVNRKAHQINSLRQRGFHVEAVIEPDPVASETLIAQGFTVLTFTHAQYAMPQWRPDFEEKRKPWAEFEAEAIRLAELRALDERLKELHKKDTD